MNTPTNPSVKRVLETFLALPVALAVGLVPAAAQTTYWVDSGGKGSSFFGGNADRAYLGVQLEEEIEHREGGARVTDVVEDSPADRAGLEVGDIIVGIDGRTIRGPVALTRQIHAAKPGDKATLKVVRSGRTRSVDIEFGERKSVWSIGTGQGYKVLSPSASGSGFAFQCDGDEDDCETFSFGSLGNKFTVGDCEDGECGYSLLWNPSRPVLGVELVEVTDELREHLGGSRGAGVLVSKIVPGSAAERAGIRVGDLIVSVGGETVAGIGALRNALSDKRGETFRVEVVREGRSRSIDVSVPEPKVDRPTGPRAGRLVSSPVRVARVAAPAPPPAPAPRPVVGVVAPVAPPAPRPVVAAVSPVAPPAPRPVVAAVPVGPGPARGGLAISPAPVPRVPAGPIPMVAPGPPGVVAPAPPDSPAVPAPPRGRAVIL